MLLYHKNKHRPFNCFQCNFSCLNHIPLFSPFFYLVHPYKYINYFLKMAFANCRIFFLVNSICDLPWTFCYVLPLQRRTKVQQALQIRTTGAIGKKKKKNEKNECSPSHWHSHVSCACRGLSGGPAVKWVQKRGEVNSVKSVPKKNNYEQRLEWGNGDIITSFYSCL